MKFALELTDKHIWLVDKGDIAISAFTLYLYTYIDESTDVNSVLNVIYLPLPLGLFILIRYVGSSYFTNM